MATLNNNFVALLQQYPLPRSFHAFLAVICTITLFASTPTAHAQIRSGTIIVVGFSKHKIVVAADSRMTEEDATHHDDICKITLLNDRFVFVASGRFIDRTRGVVGWDAAREARTAFLSTRRQTTGRVNGDFVSDVARVWGTLMERNIGEYIRPQELSKLDPKKIYVEGIFIGPDDNGNVQAVDERLVYRSENKAVVRKPWSHYPNSSDVMIYSVIGEPGVLEELKEGKTKRAQTEAKITKELAGKWNKAEADARMAIRFVELTIKYAPPVKVGGPKGVGGHVEAVELNGDGAPRWINPRNCPAK